MNELIRELAEQQGFTGPNFYISSSELEKFAELIVRECAAIVEEDGSAVLPLIILKHFGVDE